MARRINPKIDRTYTNYFASHQANPRIDRTYTNYIATQKVSDEYDFLDQYVYDDDEEEGNTFWQTIRAPFTWKFYARPRSHVPLATVSLQMIPRI